MVILTFCALLAAPSLTDFESTTPETLVAAEDEPLGVDLEVAFPKFTFERPVFLTGAGDGSGRVFVVEQAGVIWVFDGTTDTPQQKSVFLDISERVSRKGNEEGLIGLAFHPDYAANGRVYVHYSSSANDRHGTLSVFSAKDGVADEASEQILLEVKQPYRNHNGGMITFGPDRYLYMALGDGGAADDPHGHGQDLSTLLGTILRIDVDNPSDDRGYGIPADNPFVDVEGARPEIWALGLRNAWRFSFDRETGALWAGDVGQNKLEEISIVVRGGNYGWNTYEAERDFSDTELAHGEHIEPVFSYGRRDGISITGGAVYRGARYPEFAGLYFCADYFNGNVWAISSTGDGGYESELVRRSRKPIASFGEDEAGELFALAFDGRIYRIVTSDMPEGTFDDWPTKLSDAGIYSDMKAKTLADGIVEYQVNAPFWSDGAGKKRYVQLPEGTSMTYAADGAFELPVGTTIIKEFTAPGRRRERYLETRLSKKTESGWQAATYVWSATGRKARLALGGKDSRLKSETVGDGQWHAPSAAQCASCHLDDQGFALGLTAAQLNGNVAGEGEAEENQLLLLAGLGLLELPSDFEHAAAPKFVDPYGTEGTLDERARVWLDVNCAMCHQPEAKGNAQIDLRFTTALTAAGVVGAEPSQGDLGIEGAKIVAGGAPERSTLLSRIEVLDDARMPSVGVHRVDEKGAALIREWIASLPAEEPR